MRSRSFSACAFVLLLCLALLMFATTPEAAQAVAAAPGSAAAEATPTPDSITIGQDEYVALDFTDCSSAHTILTVDAAGNTNGDIVELVCSGMNIELVDGTITDGLFETTEYGTFLYRSTGGFSARLYALPEQAARLKAAIGAVGSAAAPEITEAAMPTPTRTSTRTPAPTPSPTRTPAAPPSAAASDAGATETWTEPVSGITFVRVPAGEFIMGSTEAQVSAALELCSARNNDSCDIAWFEDETPQHDVFLGYYWIGRTEVTNAQFSAFVDSGGYEDPSLWTNAGWQWREESGTTEPFCWSDLHYNRSGHPVVCVSWYEAVAFANWLAQESGLEIRLPTEAQWEKAARGTDGRTYPWGENYLDGSRANYCDINCNEVHNNEGADDNYPYSAPVESYPLGASPYGALDMSGNVAEWTNSEYYSYPYVSGDGREGSAGDAIRVARGGSFAHSDAAALRSAYRLPFSPDSIYNDFGFRVAFSGGASVEAPPTRTPSPTPTRTSTPTLTPSPTPSPTPIPLPVGVVVSEALNLRDGPGTEFPVLGKLQRDDQVTVVGQWNECAWVQVQTEQGDGWVSAAAQYLTLDAVCADIPLGEVRPLTGLVGRYVSATGPGILEVDNRFGDGLAILATEDGTPVAAAYVREGEKYTIGNIADGTYILFFSKGTGWNGKGFNNTTTLQRFEDILPYQTTATTTPGWSVTLYGTEEGTAATLNVPPEEFPQLP